jgi:D-amino-acid dehydrogenase
MRVAVVGAGVLGASAAYHLTKQGADVVIVDDCAEGRATAAGAGIVCPWSSPIEDADWYLLAQLGGKYYPALVASMASEGEGSVSYRRTGALVLQRNPVDLDRAERRVRSRIISEPEAGAVERLSPKEARELFPALSDEYHALHIAGAARVDGQALSQALCRLATRSGAAFLRGTARLEASGGSIRGVRVDDNLIETDEVILTGGAWANNALSPLGFRIAVEPQRGQILHLRLSGVETARWPVLLPLTPYYLLAFDDSRVVVGATRETGSGFDYRVTATGLAEILQVALSIAPGLANATVLETRVGFRPMPKDAKPMMGRIKGVEGLIVGNGLGHSGLMIGPYAGKLLAELALRFEPEIDLSPYTPQ